MARQYRRLLTIIGAATVAACSDQSDRTPSPTAPSPARPNSVPSSAALEAQINSLITALYPPRLQGGVFSAFAQIKAQIASGQTATAQTSLVAFFSEVLQDQKNGVLLDPNGSSPPTTADALRSLLSSVAAFGGIASPIPAPAADGAVAVIGTAGGTLLSSSGYGGVSFPPGALPSDVIVVINRLPAPTQPKAGPLPTTLDQYPLFYEFSTIPALAEFAQPVAVGVCQLEVGEPFAPATQAIADRLQLAHPNPLNPGTVEILPRVNADFMHCDGVSLASAATSSQSTRLASRAVDALSKFGSKLASLFTPTPAYAVHGGLGGLTKSFSPFAAVDPGVTTVGVCSSPMSGVSATYATIDLAMGGVTPGGTIRVCPQTVTIPATYVVTKPVTIEGSDPVSPPQFIVNPPVTVGFLVAPTLQGSVTFRNLAITLTGTIPSAIDLGAGQANTSPPGTWWEVIVENSIFTMPPGSGRAVRAFYTSYRHPRLIYRFNQSSGGFFPVVTLTGATDSDIEVLSNSFTGPFSNAGVRTQNEGNVVVAGNLFSTCGLNAMCVRVDNAGSATITNNSITIPSTASAQAGIAVFGSNGALPSTASITSNTILGGGLTGPATDTASYRFKSAAILVSVLPPLNNPVPENFATPLTVDVSSNIGTSGASGIRIAGGGIGVTGTNNSISQVHSVVRLDNSSGTPSSLVNHGDDFATFVSAIRFSWPLASPSTIDVQCNWWGTAAGPLAFAPGIPTAMYSPFATGPVVNNAGGQCNGTTP